MKRQLIIFLICVALIALNGRVAKAQWERQNSNTKASLNDVYFVDDFHGWAVGDSATILATTDGGETWAHQICLIDTSILEQVFFINQDKGYILGSKSFERGSFILSTRNGGQNWLLSYGPIDFWLTDFFFISADSGWAVGGDFHLSRQNGIILHTADGGQTWRPQLETPSPSFPSQLFGAVAFLNHQEGWAFGSSYFDNFSEMNVYKTIDSGQNWSIIVSDINALFEMSMVSPDTIWGGWFSFGKSTDGGLNWEYQYWPISYVSSILDIDQIDGQTGWLIARLPKDSVVGASKILYTEDGGATFTVIFADSSGKNLNAITRHNQNFWVVGFSGLILHHRGYPTSVNSDPQLIPQRVELLQNFPNPFNSGTTINFAISRQEHVTIAIHDLQGRMIATLLSRVLPPGTYSVTWDGKDETKKKTVASGVYIYEIRTPDFAQARKMIMIK